MFELCQLISTQRPLATDETWKSRNFMKNQITLAVNDGSIEGSECLHYFNVGESLDVRVGLVASAFEVIACLDALRTHPVASLSVLVHSRWVTEALRAQEAAGKADAATDFLTLVWIPEDPRQTQTGADELWHLFRSRRGNVYRISLDAGRAVVNTIQRVRTGETCAILWPVDLGLPSALALIAEGVNLRGTSQIEQDDRFTARDLLPDIAIASSIALLGT
jgi:hypothetical protein